MATQTIYSLPAFQQQRTCVIPCFQYGEPGSGRDILGETIKCQTPVLDTCYCRPDLRSVASAWLSTCINEQCSSNSQDFSTALSIYDAYCGGRGGIGGSDGNGGSGGEGESGSSEATATQEAPAKTQGAANTGGGAPVQTVRVTSTVTAASGASGGSMRSVKAKWFYGLVILAVASL